jgi:arylsulfatase A-like enzyme
VRRAVLATLACLALGCGAEHRPNVVLIVIDTLRADHLPFYGYRRDTAPFLSMLAEQGAVFEHAVAPASSTAPSTASVFTSLYPTEHGVQNGLAATAKMRKVDPTLELNRIPEELRTLPELMDQAGYVTFGISDNVNVGESLGFTQGFDRFKLYGDKSASVVNARLRRWRPELQQAKHYFLYIHYIDPHAPYRERCPWYETWSAESDPSLAAYDSEIAYVDHHIAELYRLYGWDRNTLLVVTADHGEEFLDHGGTGHGAQLYGELINVPLLVHEPGRIQPQRRRETVSTVDILPTLVEVARAELPEGLEGRSFWPLLEGKSAEGQERPVLAEALKKRKGVLHYLKRAVVSGGWKYMRYEPLEKGAPDRELLFHVESDPKERENRIGDERARADALARELDGFEARAGTHDERVRVPIDDDTRKQLEELGYVE